MILTAVLIQFPLGKIFKAISLKFSLITWSLLYLFLATGP